MRGTQQTTEAIYGAFSSSCVWFQQATFEGFQRSFQSEQQGQGSLRFECASAASAKRLEPACVMGTFTDAAATDLRPAPRPGPLCDIQKNNAAKTYSYCAVLRTEEKMDTP